MIRLLSFIFVFWPFYGYAETSLSHSAPQGIDSADWLSWSLSLVVVLIAIGLCAWLAKKSRMTSFGQGQMKVIANLSLGTKERVVVVQIGQQQYVLGVTGQHIELIDKLADPLQENTQLSGFAKQLNRMLKGNERET